MSIEVIPTGAAIGAEIRGVNLAQPLDRATFAAVEDAYNTYGVIFFRDQSLTPSQQVAFTRRFSEMKRAEILRRVVAKRRPC
jgi:taurine dioxygenase